MAKMLVGPEELFSVLLACYIFAQFSPHLPLPAPFISHTTTCHANLPADGAVMKAWGKDQKIDGTNIRFMGDPAAELTKKLDMEMNHPGPASDGIIGRCKRHALIVDDGQVKWFAISEDDDDPAGDEDPEDTCAPAILEALKSL